MGNEGKDFLIKILPFLRIKRKHARLGIEFQKYRAGKCPDEKQLQKRDWYKEEIRKINLGRLPSDRGELIKTPMEMLPPQLSEGGCV